MVYANHSTVKLHFAANQQNVFQRRNKRDNYDSAQIDRQLFWLNVGLLYHPKAIIIICYPILFCF